jgi:hypothetical protein
MSYDTAAEARFLLFIILMLHLAFSWKSGQLHANGDFQPKACAHLACARGWRSMVLVCQPHINTYLRRKPKSSMCIETSFHCLFDQYQVSVCQTAYSPRIMATPIERMRLPFGGSQA